MHGIARRMTSDHRHLAKLLELSSFDEFRAGLLTHIAIEEKLLMPLLAKANRSAELLTALRADHSALAALTIPSPRAELLRHIRQILDRHDQLEEGPGGLYAQCEELAADRSGELLRKIEAFSPAVVSPHRDGVAIERHIAWSLGQASVARARLR